MSRISSGVGSGRGIAAGDTTLGDWLEAWRTKGFRSNSAFDREGTLLREGRKGRSALPASSKDRRGRGKERRPQDRQEFLESLSGKCSTVPQGQNEDEGGLCEIEATDRGEDRGETKSLSDDESENRESLKSSMGLLSPILTRS
ncbi:hypothetical protein H0H81_001536 [Sphagnurus paluster]|uniref:Uncharacterized protein n=1 Tax=Sphagnurus paluster TaxID=117069 RepID=A0A9P7FVW7_9AGAR|nr:hypothetical protein H0H81_001536 [Sphagnurus paluster]